MLLFLTREIRQQDRSESAPSPAGRPARGGFLEGLQPTQSLSGSARRARYLLSAGAVSIGSKHQTSCAYWICGARQIHYSSEEVVVVRQTDNLAPIIALAQRNDQQAYEQLYNHYAGDLYRYIYARCGDRSLTEEALGELWLRVVQYLPTFRIPSRGADQAFSGWLYTIARNLSIDSLRSRRQTTVDLSESFASSEPDLDHKLEQADDHELLAKAMQLLTAEQREVLVLRFHEGLSSIDVARRTGRTESAVKALQHRALAALARTMGIQQQRESEHALPTSVERRRYP